MQPDWWKYVVDIAQILSALGTCGAVVVALWVALRPPQIHLSGNVGMRVVAGSGVEGMPLYVHIRITNNGEREIFVTSLTWVPAKKSQLHAIQPAGHNDRLVESDRLPKKLAFGESTQFFLATDGELDWFAGVLRHPDIWLRAYSRKESLKNLRLYVSTSVGRVHKIKPEQPFLDRLWTYIEKAMQERDAKVATGSKDVLEIQVDDPRGRETQ